MVAGAVEKSGLGSLAGLPNNTHRQWWRDPALLRLDIIMICISVVQVTGGYDQSLLGSLQALDTWLEPMGYPNASQIGTISILMIAGNIASTYPAQWICDKYGRRWTIVFGSLFCIASALVQTFSYSRGQYMAGRFLLGFGVTPSIVGASCLVNELSHPRQRPFIGAAYNVIWYIGSIIATWLCYGLTSHISGSWQWRGPSIVQLLPSLFILATIFLFPESPRWLIAKGREEEALEILIKHHANGDREDPMVLAEYSEIRETLRLEAEQQNGTTWKSTIATPGNRRRLLVIGVLATINSWTGQGIISYYLTPVLKGAGITETLPILGITGGNSICNFFVAAFSAWLAGKIARRTQFFISYGGMLVTHVIMTILSATYAKTPSVTIGNAIVAFLYLESAFYNVAMNPLVYAYPTEILSFSMRAKGLSFSLFVTFIWYLITNYVHPVALASIGYWYYVFFCFIYAIEIAAIYFLFPETRGRTLEEVGEIFDGPSDIAAHAQVAAAAGHHSPEIDDEKVDLAQEDNKEVSSSQVVEEVKQ
ncbi:hypothetical protein CI109_104412 [Kwoniella shandongensis]|uniref:Uncharacterized protein n=1 Tax=Kwoniella shandongensis TaxID=1734106 RepID=A0A5M6BWW1_9TREE|nr:uncharacterized protein CI109_004189 [Kwoniella shandongensis]KAA5527376.1 hypothetical protein CI109_004189 [Kwoniella shandongensis]